MDEGRREREREGERQRERERESERERDGWAARDEKRKRETEETERLYGTVVVATQLLVQSWGGARTHTAPLSWGRKEYQDTS
jgi:hypothetical protein